MSRIKITDTSLRDGHQSLWATRMTTADMLPVLENIDKVGYHSLEVWGGATFDVCIRYLNEDPWERLRTIRKTIKNTPLQMLLRGQSLVGYMHYPDDAVEKFVEKAAENGIDIFRVFDALNDVRNFETALKAIKETGKHAQACVVYTVSPVHSLQYFVDTALKLQDMGADSICVKDMAGLLAPYAAYDLVRALKDNLQLPIQLHTHYIGGLAISTLLKAAEAGIDIVDTASVPMAFGSSQPPVETIVRALQDSEWDTGLDLRLLFDIATHFEQIRQHKGFERGVTKINDMKVFEHQVPGGMISNFYSQLEEQKAVERLEEVLAEIPLVRGDLGYPPLVTPTSQLVGTQAVVNVLMGERYKLCPGGVKDYVRGLYGRSPEPISDEIKQKIIGEESVITVRPADLLEPVWEKAGNETRGIAESEEDILTYILFPQVALKFFEYRRNQDPGGLSQVTSDDDAAEELIKDEMAILDKPVARARKKLVSGGDENMNIDEIRELILILNQSNITDFEVQKDGFKLSLKKAASADNNDLPSDNYEQVAVPKVGHEETAAPIYENAIEILAPMVGTFYAAAAPDAEPYVKIGEHVEAGQTLCILEAMKLFNEIKSEFAGTILEVLVENAQPVEFGQTLFVIDKDER